MCRGGRPLPQPLPLPLVTPPWRSRLKRRMSRRAIRCTARVEKAHGPKSSAQPTDGSKRCSDPTFARVRVRGR
eukprot:scaffold73245_cov61-Phaeocystis_antarctica.AAC.2